MIAFILAGGERRPGRQPTEDRIAIYDIQTGKRMRRWNDSGFPTSHTEGLAFSSDNRLLASSDGEEVHVWEVATAKKIRTFQGHRSDIISVAFKNDGRRLASSSRDNTTLIWDMTFSPRNADLGTGKPGEKDLASWWADLAGDDAAQAYTAIWQLATRPEASVPFLREWLKPVPEAQQKEIAQHIKDLESEEFKVWQRALEQIEALGPDAIPALRQALERHLLPEVRNRATSLLDSLMAKPLAGEPLRTHRALAALEYAGTPDARRLLESLAKGAPEARLTQEAKASLERLSKQMAAAP
jgi:hypothetical protein